MKYVSCPKCGDQVPTSFHPIQCYKCGPFHVEPSLLERDSVGEAIEERASRMKWIGLGIAIAGAAIVSYIEGSPRFLLFAIALAVVLGVIWPIVLWVVVKLREQTAKQQANEQKGPSEISSNDSSGSS